MSDMLGLDSGAALKMMTRPTYSTAQNPYGRGGVGQRESGSNKIVGYQKPATPTLAQRANNIEIDAARKRIAALKVEPGETRRAAILRRSQKTSDTGRENPIYDPMLDRDFRLATQRMVGEDTRYAGFRSALDAKSPPAAKLPQTAPSSGNAVLAPLMNPDFLDAFPETPSSARFGNTVAGIRGTPSEHARRHAAVAGAPRRNRSSRTARKISTLSSRASFIST